MKKFIAAVMAVFILASLTGCASISYIFFYDEVMGYSTVIEAEIPVGGWLSRGYTKDQLKEFLYDYSAMMRGVYLNGYDDIVEVYEFAGYPSAYWSMQFEESGGNYYFTDTLEFGDEADYVAFYGLGDSSDSGPEPVIERKLFTQSRTMVFSNPFSGFYSNINNADSPDMYRLFLNGYGDFIGFRSRFPAISLAEADNIALQYIFTCLRSYSGIDHDDYQRNIRERAYLWEFNISNVDSKTITIKYTIPNPVGWYLLSIVLAPIIGLLFYFIFKSVHKRKEERQRLQQEFIAKNGYDPRMFGNNYQQPGNNMPYFTNTRQGNYPQQGGNPYSQGGTPYQGNPYNSGAQNPNQNTGSPFEEYEQPANRPYFGTNAQQGAPQYFGNNAQPPIKANSGQDKNNGDNDKDNT